MSGDYDPNKNSERSHALAIKALREINIRNGNILATTPEEQRWKREGSKPPSELDALRPPERQKRKAGEAAA